MLLWGRLGARVLRARIPPSLATPARHGSVRQWFSTARSAARSSPTVSAPSASSAGTMFVSTRQEVLDALGESDTAILDRNCFIGSVQYFDPAEATEYMNELRDDSDDGEAATTSSSLSYGQLSTGKDNKASTDAAEACDDVTDDAPTTSSTGTSTGWHLEEDGPLTRFVVCVARSTGPVAPEQHEGRGAPTTMEEILDVVLPAFAGEKMLEEELRQRGALGVWWGEVDALGLTAWQFGFMKHHTLAFFDSNATVAEVGQKDGTPVLHLHTAVDNASVGHGEDEAEKQEHVGAAIPLADIADVRVRLKGPSKTLAVYTSQGDEIPILRDTSGEDLDALDESQVMVVSEWLVKAAGSLVALLRQYGYPAQLRLPRVLLPDHNTKVAARNKGWKSALQQQQQQQQQR